LLAELQYVKNYVVTWRPDICVPFDLDRTQPGVSMNRLQVQL